MKLSSAACLVLLFTLLLTACGSDSNNDDPLEVDRSTSIAHRWNEALLESIRKDRARPPMHARNLFHTSAAMYDAWAIYAGDKNPQPSTYLLGKTLGDFSCPLTTEITADQPLAAQQEAISFAMYRLIKQRFLQSPGYSSSTLPLINSLMSELGYDPENTSTDYTQGAAELGNYIAQCYLAYGLQDGSNEAASFANQSYQPINPPLVPTLPGNPNVENLDRWQPLTLDVFIDQGGNVIVGGFPPFLGAEWGRVAPFALSNADKTVYNRNDFDYPVYHDPGAPPSSAGEWADEFAWSFALVAKWSSHLDPTDGVMIDISPASIGNIGALPTDWVGQRSFYDANNGGDSSRGRSLNPVTGKPYQPQMVPRGDYTRVLAEFWADGPNSETPPGHWFHLLNQVGEHSLFTKRYAGEGKSLSSLEWDVKAYFALGGAMHDAAIAAWGIKGWYDYTRPVSAIRALAGYGQRTDPELPAYNPNGIEVEPGFIELVGEGDPLVGDENQHLHKIKLKAWRGPTAISNPAEDTAGVTWILAENWWPYQRPSFVTPPFGGYVSGHSTYSRAAAEVLTAITGDEFFPGGKSEFTAKANDYLVFENGPSVDVTLEWATYRDAADQCSLSRIWGGIHPPMDDIPGRLIGAQVAADAVALAEAYFKGER